MSSLGSLYIKLGEPDGEISGCCDLSDWAAQYIIELKNKIEQLELNGPVMIRGSHSDGSDLMGTMRDAMSDYRDAADCEAAEVDRLNKLLKIRFNQTIF